MFYEVLFCNDLFNVVPLGCYLNWTWCKRATIYYLREISNELGGMHLNKHNKVLGWEWRYNHNATLYSVTWWKVADFIYFKLDTFESWFSFDYESDKQPD